MHGKDLTADGHTKGCIDSKLLLDLMSGAQNLSELKKQLISPFLHDLLPKVPEFVGQYYWLIELIVLVTG